MLFWLLAWSRVRELVKQKGVEEKFGRTSVSLRIRVFGRIQINIEFLLDFFEIP